MAKRFTDTDIWGEDWFLDLGYECMIFWKYIIDNCDHAGIWKPNKIRFNKLTGLNIDHEKARKKINSDKERIAILSNNRWFLTGFIPFQYGTKLNLLNRMHRSIYELLLANDVDLTSIRPQIEVTQGVKDKVKDKDKDFDSIWDRYPRKDGRKEAERHFNATIGNKQDYDNINKALDNYIAYLKKNQTEDKYIKMGSTWFNNWRDWIDQGSGNKPPKSSIEDRAKFMRG